MTKHSFKQLKSLTPSYLQIQEINVLKIKKQKKRQIEKLKHNLNNNSFKRSSDALKMPGRNYSNLVYKTKIKQGKKYINKIMVILFDLSYR